MNEKQKALAEKVYKHRDMIFDAERYIWQHPQTGFKEWDAHRYLDDRFTKLGYNVVEAGNIPGFYADIDTGKPGPKIAVLGELDALNCAGHPEATDGLAHACGHNAQCAALLGFAAALKEDGALDNLCGSIRLIAVPAEELIEIEYRQKLREQGAIKYLGGKAEFMSRGFFDGVDMAYMLHTMGGDSLDFFSYGGSVG